LEKKFNVTSKNLTIAQTEYKRVESDLTKKLKVTEKEKKALNSELEKLK